MQDGDRISFLQARGIIVSWLTSRSLPGVSVEQNDEPASGLWEDYVIKYEVILHPRDDRRPYLSLRVTDDGYVGVVFEWRERLASRFGVVNLQKRSCAVGHEPSAVTSTQLEGFLLAVERGAITLITFRWPWPILGSVRAIIEEPQPWFGPQMPRSWRWLSVWPRDKQISRHYQVADYDPL